MSSQLRVRVLKVKTEASWSEHFQIYEHCEAASSKPAGVSLIWRVVYLSWPWTTDSFQPSMQWHTRDTCEVLHVCVDAALMPFHNDSYSSFMMLRGSFISAVLFRLKWREWHRSFCKSTRRLHLVLVCRLRRSLSSHGNNSPPKAICHLMYFPLIVRRCAVH